MTGLVERLRRLRRRLRDRRVLAGSPLFDPAWYRATYPDAGADPLDHYLGAGAAEGRRPSPWFDGRWYLSRYADVAATGQNPLAHYILAGAAEDRDPNPWFSTRWYRKANPEAAKTATPLDHYVTAGAKARRDPSPRFDAAWYAECNPEGAADPLAHFLLAGQAAGRKPSRYDGDRFRGEPVEAARLTAFKALEPVRPGPVALLVAHAPEGRLKPNVEPYARGLHAAGVQVVLIAAADRPFAPPAGLDRVLAGGYVRENRGFDFAAWAHLMRAEPGLFAADLLLLVNDSVIPAADPARLAAFVEALRAHPSEVTGATDSAEHGWHLQSYCLAIKGRALSSAALHGFFGEVRSLADKDEVIRAYEVALTDRLQAAGLSCAALHPSADGRNRTVFDWRGLAGDGFPLVKTLTLRGGYEGVDIEGWRGTLSGAGFDVALIEATLASPTRAEPPPPGWPLLAPPAARPAPRAPWKVAFVGPWNYGSGLGAAGRGYLKALWRTGARLALHPIEAPLHVHAPVTAPYAACDFAGEADVAIVHLNPDSWHLLTDAQRAVIEGAHRRVGLFAWEMGSLPDGWRTNLARVDAVWAPSRYCADIFAAATAAPVTIVPHVVAVAPSPAVDRAAVLARLGLPPEARFVLYAFDGASYLVRKNPDALVRAFAASALAEQGWRLVLKTKHLMERPEEGGALAALVAVAPGAVLIDAPLPRDEMAALFAAADVYASPHRSEGFGLTIAEAMAAGKPVVASDFGGSRDFLDAGCGFPVPARAVPLERTHGHYTAGAVWGEVDEDAFAQALRAAVAAGPEIGAAARARIAERLSAEAVAGVIRSALDALMADEAARAA